MTRWLCCHPFWNPPDSDASYWCRGCELPLAPVTSNQASSPLTASPARGPTADEQPTCRPLQNLLQARVGEPGRRNQAQSLLLGHTEPDSDAACKSLLPGRPGKRMLTLSPHTGEREAWAPASPHRSPQHLLPGKPRALQDQDSGRGRSGRVTAPWKGKSHGTELCSPTGRPAGKDAHLQPGEEKGRMGWQSADPGASLGLWSSLTLCPFSVFPAKSPQGLSAYL